MKEMMSFFKVNIYVSVSNYENKNIRCILENVFNLFNNAN